jgi:hypothetical protein
MYVNAWEARIVSRAEKDDIDVRWHIRMETKELAHYAEKRELQEDQADTELP